MRFRVQMTCTSSTISPSHSANLRLGEVNGPVAARKRVTGANDTCFLCCFSKCTKTWELAWQQLLIWIQERVIVPYQHYTDLGDMSHENLDLSVVRHFVYLFICGKKKYTHIIHHFAKGKRPLFQVVLTIKRFVKGLTPEQQKIVRWARNQCIRFWRQVIEDKKIERFLLQCSLSNMGQYKYFL